MIKGRTSSRQALLRAVSALSISLGVTTVALADEAPKEIGSQSSGAGSGKVMNQYKSNSNQLKYHSTQIKGESNQLKYTNQIKGESNQLKYQSNHIKGESNQIKYHSNGPHELNPQPLPPG